jgi:phosphoglycerate dehydrogenase-like enzyme
MLKILFAAPKSA